MYGLLHLPPNESIQVASLFTHENYEDFCTEKTLAESSFYRRFGAIAHEVIDVMSIYEVKSCIIVLSPCLAETIVVNIIVRIKAKIGFVSIRHD